jgi:hypothetical protein
MDLCVAERCIGWYFFQKTNEKLAAGDFKMPPPQKTVELKADKSNREVRAARLAAKNAEKK